MSVQRVTGTATGPDNVIADGGNTGSRIARGGSAGRRSDAVKRGTFTPGTSFEAVTRGVLSGICVNLEHTSTINGRLASGWFNGAALILGELACLPAARVLEWEESA
jgi:hypothetical protein